MCAAAVVLLLIFTSLICSCELHEEKEEIKDIRKGLHDTAQEMMMWSHLHSLDFIPSTKIDEEDNVSIDKKDTDQLNQLNSVWEYLWKTHPLLGGGGCVWP